MVRRAWLSRVVGAVLPGVIALGMWGCAPPERVDILERRVISLAQQQQQLERRIQAVDRKTSRVGQEDIQEIRRKQADLYSQIDQIQAEMLRINGLIEEIQHSSAEREKALKELQARLEARLDKVEKELLLLQKSAKAAREVEEARKKIAEQGIDLYQQALDLFKERKFKESKRSLEEYLKKFPSGELAPNAYFWMGECEYRMDRYEEAILDYQKVITNYPKSTKVPDALWKQGMAFLKLGDPESAKIVFTKLVKLYPKSHQAANAKKQLKRLK